MGSVVQFIVSFLLVMNILALLGSLDNITPLEAELSAHEQLIEECGKNIPRNKTCKLVAVEESE